MNKIASGICAACILVTMNVSAGTTRIGGHAGYITGGDIVEDSAAAGGQIEFDFTHNLGIQISATLFEEEVESAMPGLDYDEQVSLTSIGLSTVFRLPLDPVDLYALIGVNHNTGTVDAPTSISIFTSNMQADVDGIGFHAGVGLCVHLSDRFELFAEYRHTSLELEGNADVRATNFMGVTMTGSADIEFDYDFGFAKVGFNILF